MKEVKRIVSDYWGEVVTDDSVPIPDGEYVLASDYDTLMVENKRLQKVILDSSGCFTKAQVEAILDDNDLDRG